MLSVSYSRELKAPVNAGDVMGTLTYSAPGGYTYQYTLVAANSVAAAPAAVPPTIDEAIQPQGETESSAPNKLIWIVPLICVIAVLFIMIAINVARERARRRRRRARRGYGYYDYDPYNRRK